MIFQMLCQTVMQICMHKRKVSFIEIIENVLDKEFEDVRD